MSREKQIEEITNELIFLGNVNRGIIAKHLYEKGYRKQSVGEWETIPDCQPDKLLTYRHICSVCKTTYKDIRPYGHKYCHECGAKMKGGAE